MAWSESKSLLDRCCKNDFLLQSLVLSKAGTIGTCINYPSKKGVHWRAPCPRCSKGGKCYPSNQREWILKYLSTRYWIQCLSNEALIESQRRELKNDRNKLFWSSLGVCFRRFSLQQRCSVLKQSSLVHSHQEMQCLETTWSLNTWSPQKLNVAISARESPSAFHLIISTTLLRIRCSTNARLTTINSKMILKVSWARMDSATMNVRYMMNTS